MCSFLAPCGRRICRSATTLYSGCRTDHRFLWSVASRGSSHCRPSRSENATDDTNRSSVPPLSHQASTFLCHLLRFQARGIGEIAPLDVFFQPVLDELQNLNRHGGPAAGELGLKCQYLFDQRIVLRLVSGEVRIVVQLHEAFFVGEVHRGVLDQPVQDTRQHALSLAGAHGRIQLAPEGEQILVLGVDSPDTNGTTHCASPSPWVQSLTRNWVFCSISAAQLTYVDSII